MSEAAVQIGLVWVTEALYVLGFVLLVLGFALGRDRWIERSFAALAVGLVPHTGAIILRWIEAGHAPYIQFYEVILSDTWFGVAIFLLLVWRYPRLRPAGLVAMPLTVILLGIAVFSSTEIRSLPPTFQTYWLIVHILFAKLTYGSWLVAADLGFLYLLKERFLRRLSGLAADESVLAAEGAGLSADESGLSADESGPSAENLTGSSRLAKFYLRLPQLGRLDELSYQFVVAGFLFCGVMIASGSVWANNAWGQYWGWDPVETWSLVTWLVYGLYLHLRLKRGWWGTRSAWYSLGALGVALAAFFVMPYVMDSIHSAYLGSSFQQ
ncbi:MAG: c-type cytochrome biogenesis protein CcsB [Thermoleophilia bacterium]